MQQKLTTTEARAGQTTGRMRWVLHLSTVGAIIALAVVWFVFFS